MDQQSPQTENYILKQKNKGLQYTTPCTNFALLVSFSFYFFFFFHMI